VQVPLLARRKDRIRNQGRANAALLLLARAMHAEFVEPTSRNAFATVRGRAAGCTFELHLTNEKTTLTARHFHTQQTFRLDATGCVPPDLDPALLRAAVEETCDRFATTH
jgi:hypothetical protein